MRKLTFSLLIIMALKITAYSQEEQTDEFKPSGKVTGKVFLNYHFDASEDSDQRNSFELKRAYLGYKYNFSENLSAKILLDGSKESEASSYTMFVKNALLDWKANEQIKLSAGVIGQTQYNTQEKLFGYRYVHKTMQDYYKFMSSADLGINAEFKPIDGLTANLFVLNGEGYTALQDDMGRVKIGANVAYEPVKALVVKAYYDMYGGKVLSDSNGVTSDTAKIHTVGFYVGVKTEAFRAGVDFLTQMNATKYNVIADGLNRTAIAANLAYSISNKIEFFGEYLMLTSNTLDGADDPWNINSNGSTIIAGCQFNPVKGVKTALNYQGNYYAADGTNPNHYIYLNLELAF